MPRTTTEPHTAYRILHAHNLPSIIEQGGMWCGREMAARNLPYTTIGLNGLTASRECTQVPCGPGGCLSDYVPFHFCPRSVMLYAIHTGRSDYHGGQDPVIHVVTTVERVGELGLGMVYTDRHARLRYANFSDDPDRLDTLDWQAIASCDFRRSEDDPDRPNRKEAELLVHRFVPLEAVVEIGVYNANWRSYCEKQLQGKYPQIPVNMHTGWYF